jgi:hypothetical protein
MTSMLAATAIDHEFESLSAQTKEYEMGICCSCDKGNNDEFRFVLEQHA